MRSKSTSEHKASYFATFCTQSFVQSHPIKLKSKKSYYSSWWMQLFHCMNSSFHYCICKILCKKLRIFWRFSVDAERKCSSSQLPAREKMSKMAYYFAPSSKWAFDSHMSVYVCFLLRDVCVHGATIFACSSNFCLSQNGTQHTFIFREKRKKQQCRQWMLCYSFIRNAHVKKSLVIHSYGMSCALWRIFIAFFFSLILIPNFVISFWKQKHHYITLFSHLVLLKLHYFSFAQPETERKRVSVTKGKTHYDEWWNKNIQKMVRLRSIFW